MSRSIRGVRLTAAGFCRVKAPTRSGSIAPRAIPPDDTIARRRNVRAPASGGVAHGGVEHERVKGAKGDFLLIEKKRRGGQGIGVQLSGQVMRHLATRWLMRFLDDATPNLSPGTLGGIHLRSLESTEYIVCQTKTPRKSTQTRTFICRNSCVRNRMHRPLIIQQQEVSARSRWVIFHVLFSSCPDETSTPTIYGPSMSVIRPMSC